MFPFLTIWISIYHTPTTRLSLFPAPFVHPSTHPSMCSIMNIIILLDFVAVAFLSSSLDFHFIIIIPSKSFWSFCSSVHSTAPTNAKPPHLFCSVLPIRIVSPSAISHTYSGCCCFCLLFVPSRSFLAIPLITGRHTPSQNTKDSCFFPLSSLSPDAAFVVALTGGWVAGWMNESEEERGMIVVCKRTNRDTSWLWVRRKVHNVPPVLLLLHLFILSPSWWLRSTTKTTTTKKKLSSSIATYLQQQ